jgi:hypothetical protein
MVNCWTRWRISFAEMVVSETVVFLVVLVWILPQSPQFSNTLSTAVLCELWLGDWYYIILNLPPESPKFDS